jgi:hypothetical protein
MLININKNNLLKDIIADFLQVSGYLFNCIYKLQEIKYSGFSGDITTNLSTSTLSLQKLEPQN